jgi:hypothetical protein
LPGYSKKHARQGEHCNNLVDPACDEGTSVFIEPGNTICVLGVIARGCIQGQKHRYDCGNKSADGAPEAQPVDLVVK